MRVVLGVLVLLVLVVAVWLPSTKDQETPGRPVATPAEAIEPPLAQAEPQQRAAVEAPAIESDQFLYRVRVVRDDTGEPVAGATVRWLPMAAYRTLSTADRALQRQDEEALLVKLGQATTTGDDGRASILGPLQDLRVTARRDALFGTSGMTVQEFRPDGPPATIAPDTEFVVEVREDRTLTVRAIDDGGRPVAGANIVLRWSVTNADGSVDRYGENLGVTGADGLAHLRHFQNHRVPASAALVAGLFGGGSDPVAFEMDPFPEQPIDLRLPLFGSLELMLLDTDGRPWPTPPGHARVHVRTVGDSTSDQPNPPQFDEHGQATVTPVLCGMEFIVRVFGGANFDRNVVGPQRAGERVPVELRLPADAPLLIARVIDAGGVPVGGTVTLEYGGTPFTTTTAANGQLRIALPSKLLGSVRTIILIRYDDRHQPTGEKATVEMRTSLVPGINDLGDLRLQGTPLLVGGRVEWPDGSAVEPPETRFERTRRNSADRWEDAADLRTEFPGDGRFVARGAADGRRWRARVEGNFVPQTLEFTAGTEDLVIRVEKGAIAIAHFLFDEGAPWQDLQYRLLSTTYEADPLDPDSAQRGRGMPRQENGRVTCGWGTLAAGTYRLTVECPGVGPPLVDLIVDVPRGAPATDPRLANIDLRGRLRKLTVSVTDATGVPLRGLRDAGVRIKGPDDPRAEWYGRALDAEGRVALTAHRPVDLLVHAAGFLTREVSAVFADTIVALDAAPRVRVRLATPLPEGTTARLDCWPQGKRASPHEQFLHRRMTLDADGTAEIVPGSDRPLELSLLLRRGRKSAPVALQAATLDPRAVPRGQVVELRIEPESQRQAIEALGKN